MISNFDEMYTRVINSLQGDAYWDETRAYLRGEYPEYPQNHTTPDYIAALDSISWRLRISTAAFFLT